MKKIESEFEKVESSNYCCSAKNCDGEGSFFLKLTVASLGGWFCESCAVELKESGIVEEVR